MMRTRARSDQTPPFFCVFYRRVVQPPKNWVTRKDTPSAYLEIFFIKENFVLKMMHLCIFCPFSDQLLKLCWRYVVSGGPRIWGELIRSRQHGRASVWIWICSIKGTCCLATFGILVNLCHDDGAQQEICCPSHKSPQTAGKIFSPIFSSLIIIFWNQIDSLPFLSPYQCWNSFFVQRHTRTTSRALSVTSEKRGKEVPSEADVVVIGEQSTKYALKALFKFQFLWGSLFHKN